MNERTIDIQIKQITKQTRRVGIATKVVFAIALLTFMQSVVFTRFFDDDMAWIPAIAFVEAMVLLGASAILRLIHRLFVGVGIALDELHRTV